MKKEKISKQKISHKTKKNEKFNTNFIKEIESSLSKRAEIFIYQEIMKSIAQNPQLMNYLSQGQKGNSVEVE